MFSIENGKLINYEKRFTGNKKYQILKYEDGFDKYLELFTYLNVYNNRIVGSFLEKNSKLHEERYMFIFVTPREYLFFKKQELSYLTLLKNREIYIQDVHDMYTRTPQFYYYKLTLEDIPKNLWPEENSYYTE